MDPCISVGSLGTRPGRLDLGFFGGLCGPVLDPREEEGEEGILTTPLLYGAPKHLSPPKERIKVGEHSLAGTIPCLA